LFGGQKKKERIIQNDALGGLLQHAPAARGFRGQSLPAQGVLRTAQQATEPHRPRHGEQGIGMEMGIPDIGLGLELGLGSKNPTCSLN